jgi:pilus assembly protein Flp/PilA
MHSTSDAPRPFVNRQCSEERMKNLIVRFISEDQGQDLIEYGLLVGIITTVGVLAITSIGGKVKVYFDTLDGVLP